MRMKEKKANGQSDRYYYYYSFAIKYLAFLCPIRRSEIKLPANNKREGEETERAAAAVELNREVISGGNSEYLLLLFTHYSNYIALLLLFVIPIKAHAG